MRSAGLFLFAASALCLAQTPASSSVSATTTIYHSDAMGIDFSYPSTFAEPKGAPADQPAQGKAGCISIPVAVMDMRTGFNMIFLKRYDRSCLGEKEDTPPDLGATAAAFLSDTLGQFGTPGLNSSKAGEISGHSAATITGSVKVLHSTGKNIIFGATSCVLTGKNVACFQFLSNDCPTLGALVASIVKLGDTPETPVIPAALTPACKP